MGEKTIPARKRSVLKGALAGLAGGIAGSGAKMLAEKMYPSQAAEQPPTTALAETLTAAHPSLAGVRKAGLHWAMGAVAGAVYGAAIEIEPKAGAWRGAAFGLALNKLTHKTLPKVGLANPAPIEDAPVRQTTQARQSAWVSHAIFGVVTEGVRRVVRKGL